MNDNVAENVIIEANSAKQALKLGEVAGLYFDGAGDCRCCGNRWSNWIDDDDGADSPMIYDEPAHNFKSSWNDETCIVHYLDGRKERIEIKCSRS